MFRSSIFGQPTFPNAVGLPELGWCWRQDSNSCEKSKAREVGEFSQIEQMNLI